MPVPESIRPYLPFILVLIVVLALYLFSLLGGRFIKPKRIILNESIGALAYPRFGILKESFFKSLNVENKTSSPPIATYGKVKVYNGWLGADFQVFDVYLEKNVSYVRMNFEVRNSNWYGDLFILVNGNKVWSKTQKGEITVLINKSYLKSGQNEILIGTDTSWRFWAPTFYDLRSLSVKAISVRKSIPRISFNVPKARGLSTYGILSFFVEQANKNPLTIKLNNKLVYSSVVKEKKYTIDISDELRKGNNSLILSTRSNNLDLSNVLLRINYRVFNSSYQTNFIVNDKEYEYLTSGLSKATLSIDLIKLLEGNLELEINNKTVWMGNQKALDVSDELRPGKNVLKLTAVEGAFYPRSLILVLR